MPGRVAPRRPHEDVKQAVAISPFREPSFYEPPVPLVGLLEAGRREVGPYVAEEYPAVACEPARHLIDVGEQLVDRLVWAISLPIVVGAVGKFLLHNRANPLVEVILDDLALHQAGVHLPIARLGRNERIKKRHEVPVLEVLVQPDEVALAVQIKMHRVYRALLVSPASVECLN